MLLVIDVGNTNTVLGVFAAVAHRPGELGRAAARLGEHKINIDYSYCGLEHGSTQEVVVFGVDNLPTAVKLLDELSCEDTA